MVSSPTKNTHFHIFLTLLLSSLIHQIQVIKGDTNTNTCPYPCNPSQTQTGPYSLSPPFGNFPNYPPPPGTTTPYGGSLTVPPPPDPILPYFPYYYRNAPRRPSDDNQISSSTWLDARSRVQIVLVLATTFLFLVGDFLFSCFF
ncbi:unnamed protein product [Amaranthus hypochondriacus]